MIDVETHLADAASRLPGPDADAIERARVHLLAAFAPTGDAPAGADPSAPADGPDTDGAGPGVRPEHRAPHRRRLLALAAGLATVAALVAAVIVAGLPHRAAPPAPPAGTGTAPVPLPTAPVPTAPARLDGTIAFLRGDVLYTATDGAEPVRLAQLPTLDDARIEQHHGDRALAVSPDGARVAVVPPGGSKRTISIYDRVTGAAKSIPMPPSFWKSRAVFSVDGKTLFVRDRFALFAVTDRARSIATGPDGALRNIAVAPDGSGIAVNGAESGLVAFDANGENGRTIVAGRTGVSGNAVWGPGADQPLAYIDAGGLHVVSAATPGAEPLSLGFDRFPLTFTRDGRELIVWIGNETPPRLAAIAIARQTGAAGTRYSAGATRRLASLSFTFLGMTQDGTALLMGGNPRDVRLVPVDGGPAQPIGVEDAEALAWSGLTPAAG